MTLPADCAQLIYESAGGVWRDGGAFDRVILGGLYDPSQPVVILKPKILHFHACWYQVLGTKYLVPGTWYQVLGTRYFVPSTWYQVLGTKYLDFDPNLTKKMEFPKFGRFYVIQYAKCSEFRPGRF